MAVQTSRSGTVSYNQTVTYRYFFSIRVFIHRHWQLIGQQGKWGNYLLFHCTTSTCSQTFRYLFVALHVRWLSHIFNCNPCVYQTATQWDLPPYRITIWFTDDVMVIFVCLLVDFILGLITAIWHEKPMDSNTHWLSSLYYKRTDQQSVLVTPQHDTLQRYYIIMLFYHQEHLKFGHQKKWKSINKKKFIILREWEVWVNE